LCEILQLLWKEFKNSFWARFEVIKVMTVKTTVFYDVLQCNLADSDCQTTWYHIPKDRNLYQFLKLKYWLWSLTFNSFMSQYSFTSSCYLQFTYFVSNKSEFTFIDTTDCWCKVFTEIRIIMIIFRVLLWMAVSFLTSFYIKIYKYQRDYLLLLSFKCMPFSKYFTVY
jgi:hypothetical protein